MKGIPVLMYHALEDKTHPAGAIDPGEQLYVLGADSFAEQLEYLHNNGYTTLLLQDTFLTYPLPQRPVMITFDDGHASNYTIALPLLKRYGFIAEFFITTGFIGRKDYLTEEQLRGLSLAGMKIGSHGVTHSLFNELTTDLITFELEQSKTRLERITGRKVTSFSAPGGRLNEQVINAGKKIGYNYFFSSEIGMMNFVTAKRLVPRIVIKHTMGMDTFVNILEGNLIFYNVHFAKQRLLQLLKIILGNRLYSKLHSFASKYS